jgi:hypothetical protein
MKDLGDNVFMYQTTPGNLGNGERLSMKVSIGPFEVRKNPYSRARTDVINVG